MLNIADIKSFKKEPIVDMDRAEKRRIFVYIRIKIQNEENENFDVHHDHLSSDFFKLKFMKINQIKYIIVIDIIFK